MKQLTDRRTNGRLKGKLPFPAVLFLLLAVTGILASAGLLTAFGADSKEGPASRIELEVSYGFGDTAKGDRYIPVRVKLEDKTGEPFEGALEILTSQSSGEVYRYEFEVEMDAGAAFQQVYYIPLGVKSDQMFVSLKDKAGTEVLKKRLKLNVNSDVSEVFAGIFCDTAEGMRYLDEVGINYGMIKTKLVALNEKTAPGEPYGYDQLDLVVITNYDFNRLSDIQQGALMRWVEDGGVILFGGGPGYRENMGKFASQLLEETQGEAAPMEVNLGAEFSQNAPQDSVLVLECADTSLKNGVVLIPGDEFPLMSYTHRKKGKIITAAFDLTDIASFCEAHPGFIEKLLTLVFGESRLNTLGQMSYAGFSSLYFSVQGLINTGNVARLPNVAAYTAIIVLYILLIGPGLYLFLKKKSLQQYYMGGVALLAFVFTGMIFIMGVKTRFRAPFVTYASVLDADPQEVREETYINVRSPFNKPYGITLNPDYMIRPITKSYYFEGITAPKFTGEESYKTALNYEKDGTAIRIRDTAAFTPKMFRLNRKYKNVAGRGIEGEITVFEGDVSGKLVNRLGIKLENAALLLYGRAVFLGDMEPDQEIVLDDLECLNYPLNYTHALAQKLTGADKYETADISDSVYMLAQERARLLSFYINQNMGEYSPEARLIAFQPENSGVDFLANDKLTAEGLTMVTSLVSASREKDGKVYRSALEQEPNIVSGNYELAYNSMYAGEPSEPAVIEYSLGNDLEIESLTFENISQAFIDNSKYPYLSVFQGKIYFYNYNTGRNDLIEAMKTSYTAQELKPYLSPSNTITVKYVSESPDELSWDKQLPMLYVTGREK